MATKTTTQVTSVSFAAPAAAASEAAIFTQLAADSNAQLTARNYLTLDSDTWDFISNEISRLVASANTGNKSSDEVSLIYGQIMMIITCEYLPTISNYLGDQIAEQASTENIASDVSAFILDAENGFNALATVGSSTSSESIADQNSLFNGVMSLIGNSVGAVPGTSYSFPVTYTNTTVTFDLNTGTQVRTSTTITKTEPSVLAFLTDPDIWGSLTPLSSSGEDQISTAMANVPAIFNATQTTLTGYTPSSAISTFTSSWSDVELSQLAEMTYTWTQVYGSSSLIPGNFGSSNAPLVYTMPNSIQADFNQASQAVQTVSTTQQTIQNFTVQEIDQYYGITNSIQQSQEAQCAAIVKHFSG